MGRAQGYRAYITIVPMAVHLCTLITTATVIFNGYTLDVCAPPIAKTSLGIVYRCKLLTRAYLDYRCSRQRVSIDALYFGCSCTLWSEASSQANTAIVNVSKNGGLPAKVMSLLGTEHYGGRANSST